MSNPFSDNPYQPPAQMATPTIPRSCLIGLALAAVGIAVQILK